MNDQSKNQLPQKGTKKPQKENQKAKRSSREFAGRFFFVFLCLFVAIDSLLND
jgi:hypothetical protein